MHIPKHGTVDATIVSILHAVDCMDRTELRGRLIAAGCSTHGINSALDRLRSDDRILILSNDGVSTYQLSRPMRNFVNGCAPHEGTDKSPIVQPARIDRFSPEMTGYVAAMWRGKRKDGLRGDAHFVSSDTAPEPFRGRIS